MGRIVGGAARQIDVRKGDTRSRQYRLARYEALDGFLQLRVVATHEDQQFQVPVRRMVHHDERRRVDRRQVQACRLMGIGGEHQGVCRWQFI